MSNTMLADTPARAPMPPCDHEPRPYTGPSREELIAMRREYISPAVFTLHREPLMIVEGYMQWLFDETGRRYLDMLGGIVTVACGHCHPKITAAVKEQADTLQHATTIYLHPNLPLLAKKLASKMPAGLDVTYFVNSGSEANDLAITMARLYTGNLDVIAVRNAYHGGSPSSLGMNSHHTWKYPLPIPSAVHHALCPDPAVSRSDPGGRWSDPGGAELPPRGVCHRPGVRGCVHRRRGADRVRPHRRALLGFPELRRHPGHRDHGQGNRQRRAARRRDHPAGDR